MNTDNTLEPTHKTHMVKFNLVGLLGITKENIEEDALDDKECQEAQVEMILSGELPSQDMGINDLFTSEV